MIIKLDLTPIEVLKLQEVLSDYWDEGPCNAGWQSDTLMKLGIKVEDNINEIVGEDKNDK